VNASTLLPFARRAQLLAFAQGLVRLKSLPGQEGNAVRFVRDWMMALGFDEVRIDAMGNVVGRMGDGPRSVLFDAHLDTVDVHDADEWQVPPFSGDIVDGRLHGRGSVDMKGAMAAAVYAAVCAREQGWTAGKSVYVSGTVMEEDCDGENLKHLFQELDLRPECVVICEPSSNRIALGHKGKAQIVIKTRGLSAHGAAPEKGVNAVYEMAEVIRRVEALNLGLPKIDGRRGSIVLSRIASKSASLNAVPSECEIYLDRRTVPGETEASVQAEIEGLVAGKDATWAVGTLRRTSWTGLEVIYEPFHPAWQIDPSHALTRTCVAAYGATFGREPADYFFWDFSTNAVTPVSLGIPTIGFGPGDPALAHMRDESCPVEEILDACRFYANLIQSI
jgi:putative selenium metabolism hydrolase